MSFLPAVWFAYLFLFPSLGWNMLTLFCCILLLIGSEKSFRLSVGLLIVTGLFGLLVAYLGRPIFLQVEQHSDPIMIFLLLQIRIPFFYYAIPLEAISSSLFSWLFTANTWEIANLLRGESMAREQIRFKFNLKSTAKYLQLIPVGLLPLILPHVFRSYSLLQDISLWLTTLCVSQIYFTIFSLLIVVTRKKIFDNPFLRATSIFSVISLVSSLYSIFEYITLEIPLGVYILSSCIASIFSALLGFSIADSIIDNTNARTSKYKL